jgi:hypothetical protein
MVIGGDERKDCIEKQICGESEREKREERKEDRRKEK